MKVVNCTGTSLEIGVEHGSVAALEIERGLKFYEELFKTTAKLSWDEVSQTALKFLPMLRKEWPHYVEEMEGVAQGAGVPLSSILALNVRTEIAYGMFSDGCTALAWHSNDAESVAFLAQNWDWQQEQAENLIRIRIHQSLRPTIDMITEAGIIGKIGLNSSGVGVCLNAIRARGLDFNRLPCHLALRAVLDSKNTIEATELLRKVGVASSCHILIADSRSALGLECSHVDIKNIYPSRKGRCNIVTHTNHFLEQHPGVEESSNLPDSPGRLERIEHLVSTTAPISDLHAISAILKDEQGYPVSICRAETEKSTVATLFSIAMDLRKVVAEVTIGRPSENGQILVLNPLA